MKDFILGAASGLIFSLVVVWVLQQSSWAVLPENKDQLFILGSSLMGGLINLMLGNSKDVTTE